LDKPTAEDEAGGSVASTEDRAGALGELLVEDVRAGYGGLLALRGVSLRVGAKEIVALVGANGAGKSTLLKVISGLLAPIGGRVWFDSRRLDGQQAHAIVRVGIAYVPEGRRLFSRLSVQENLLIGAYTRKDAVERERWLEQVFGLFPVLAERKEQPAGTLSGGEQQMLAIARGLMSGPRLLLLDEPSLGIMPRLVHRLYETIGAINRAGVTVLLVEQNVRAALSLAHRAYVLQTGQIVLQGRAAELLESELVRRAFLGL
jgi:branched-chain amino acid transport system ATP-binding protein